MHKLSVNSIESYFAYTPWQFESKVPSALGLNSND